MVELLERPCARCNGSGREADDSIYRHVGHCMDCKGSGVELTEEGEALVRLLRHYFVRRDT